jgi:tRNA(His) guanylyltransferase
MRKQIVDVIINQIYIQLRREVDMQTKSLGDRMKEYESVPRTYLMRRTPVIIRLDGKAFHTYTRRAAKPYSEDLHFLRKKTLMYLVNNIQGCIFGYSQSDEISLVLKDWQTLNTEAWFDNNVQKIVSVAASICTAQWNFQKQLLMGMEGLPNIAEFDARAWNVPREEAINYLLWRQQDWERNSVQMLASSIYSQKQLHGVSARNMKTMVEKDHGIVWGDLEPWKKQGEFYHRGKVDIEPEINIKASRRVLEELLFNTDPE